MHEVPHTETEESGEEDASNKGVEEGDLLLGGGIGGGFMTNEDIKQFHLLMETLVLPTGANILGKNIGSAKHGWLKASQWLALYTLVIPLVFPEMYMDGHDKILIESNCGKFLQKQ
ncbi:hypothetical protein O181_128024 [Austropuccinia psidii MF-1]|uniref:Uncharacterized protein n=1 Tax=Austropuccinia psidii MF-1 TaxID=1389203 RepID=A0A9Q3KZ51_9BASI|nr:hypothetical protein [Austropuccinia psidii MF-1]